jgi:hypothetical protein
MILVVAGVIYAMPRVAILVAEARGEREPDRASSSIVNKVPHRQVFAQRHDH